MSTNDLERRALLGDRQAQEEGVSMTVLFDWHSQDCRAAGTLNVAHTVT